MQLSTFVRSRRAALALTASGGLLATVGVAGLGPLAAEASSHREAPLIAGLPQYDNTDVYVFRSPDRQDTVTLAANWLPFEEPAGGPNFYSFATDARYNINIDNDGDAKPDIVYRWTFKNHYRSQNTFLYNTGPVTSLGDKDLNYYQTYQLAVIKGKKTKVLVKNGKVAPSDVGEGSMPNYQKLRNQAIKKVGSGKQQIRSFTGQAEDSFFLDLRVFDLLYGGSTDDDGTFSEDGDDTLRGFNVNSVALQVPRKQLVNKGNVGKNPVIGVWSTTDKRTAGGGYAQVSRLGIPLVNEVVLPLKLKNAFNASQPTTDLQVAGKYILKPLLPAVVQKVYGAKAPKTPRNDLLPLVTGFKGLNSPGKKVVPSDQIRLNVTTPVSSDPNRLGVIGGDNQGFPNGRRLTDDVVDIEVRVLEGALTSKNENDLEDGFTDGVDANDVEFGDSFPYLALPARGSDASPHEPQSDGGGGGLPVPREQSGGAGSSSGSDSGSGGFALPGTSSPVAPATSLGVGLIALLGGLVALTRRSRKGALAA